MENKVSMEQASDFISRLISIGPGYEVGDDFMVKDVEGNPVGVKIGKKETKPIMIIHEGMKVGEHVVLNPYKETFSRAPEREWFLSILGYTLSSYMKQLVSEAIKTGITSNGGKGDKGNYDKLPIIEPFLKQMDEKMVGEVDQISGVDFLLLEYVKKKRVAKLWTPLQDEDHQKKYKFRKKTWSVIIGLVHAFMGTEDIEETFCRKAEILDMPEMDATVKLAVDTYKVLDEPLKVFLDEDLGVGELVQHIDNLEEYHKLCNWYVGNTGAKKEDKSTVAPWDAMMGSNQTPQFTNTPQQQQQPMFVPSASIPSQPETKPMTPYGQPMPQMQQPMQMPQYGGQQGYPPVPASPYAQPPMYQAGPVYAPNPQQQGVMYAPGPQTAGGLFPGMSYSH